MPDDNSDFRKVVDELLSQPQQLWLLGAGVSRDAGIPLMRPLTDRVEACLKGQNRTDFEAIRTDLPEDSHVEHIMSQIGDLIAIAESEVRQSDEPVRCDR